MLQFGFGIFVFIVHGRDSLFIVIKKHAMLFQYYSRSGSQMIHFAKYINDVHHSTCTGRLQALPPTGARLHPSPRRRRLP